MLKKLSNKTFVFSLSVILIIFIIGTVLRFYNLGLHPAGFFCDEAGLSYTAYLIGKTGKDESGKFLPFYINIFTPRGPVAIYDQIPAIKIFGLNEFGSRFTSAFIGTLTVVIIFLLAYILFNKNVKTGIFASLLTATSPWHIHFSRFGTENIRLPFYFVIFLLLFILGVQKEKKSYLFISLFFAFVAFYSYTPANLFIPPFLFGLLLIYRKFFLKFRKVTLVFVLTAVLFSIPFLVELKNNSNNSRFSQVSVFNKKTRPEAFIQMAKTYIASFSPDFLFLKGDINMPNHFITRFSVRGMGELFLITFPFYLVGLSKIIVNIRKKEYAVILLWLLLYPIGSVFAGADGGGPFATRSIIGVLVFPLITSLGFITILSWIRNKTFKNLFAVLTFFSIMISLILFIKLYFFEYPKYSLDFWGWQYGAREIVTLFMKYQDDYDELFMSPDYNAPEIFLKFYGKGKCEKCRIGLPENSYSPNKKQLFALTPSYIQKNNLNLNIIESVYYPSGGIAFEIGTIKSEK